MGERDDMGRELERSGVVYARIIFSIHEAKARVDAVILYDGYAPPWHHELGDGHSGRSRRARSAAACG